MRNPLPASVHGGAVITLLFSMLTGIVHAQSASSAGTANPPDGSSKTPSQGAWTKNYGEPRVSHKNSARADRVAAATPAGPVQTGAAAAGAAAAAAQPPAPEAQPPAVGAGPPTTVPPAGIAPGEPGSNLSDLSLPAAERGLGGGEPTDAAAAAEESRPRKKRRKTPAAC